MADIPSKNALIQSTAGAVPVRNEKGEIYMQKVKVQRYVSGRRPRYAPEDTSSEESEPEEDFVSERHHQNVGTAVRGAPSSGQHVATEAPPVIPPEVEMSDPRLARLRRKQMEREGDDSDDDVRARHRAIHEPEVVSEADLGNRARWHDSDSEGSDAEQQQLDDEELERRRLIMKQRALARNQEQELLAVEEENKSGTEESESEYEEYTESEEDAEGPRLKPVFVRKRDRVTIQEREKLIQKQNEQEQQQKKREEERRKETLRMLEEELTKETKEIKEATGVEDVDTGDENDEIAYEAWKIRELKRIKRDKEERDQAEKERLEIERLRNMTEEERRMELRNNPKVIVNKASKGKYSFLQKYYHRGAFFVHEKEDEVFKRDFTAPTLEDHFDKTVLPKVMQVKNFGRSGRTKYTHLVDQDTTQYDSPWVVETAQNFKFYTNHAGGSKQVFEKPSAKKKR